MASRLVDVYTVLKRIRMRLRAPAWNTFATLKNSTTEKFVITNEIAAQAVHETLIAACS